MIYDASKKAKILTYTNLHRPIAECADVVWDSLTSNKIHDIEVVQKQSNTLYNTHNKNRHTDTVSKAGTQLLLLQ